MTRPCLAGYTYATQLTLQVLDDEHSGLGYIVPRPRARACNPDIQPSTVGKFSIPCHFSFTITVHHQRPSAPSARSG